MRYVRVTSAAALLLLCATIGPAYAQNDRQDDKPGKPEGQQGRHEQGAPPAARQQHPQNQREEPHGQRGQPEQRRVEQAQQPPQGQRIEQPRPQGARQSQVERQPEERVQQNQQQRQQQGGQASHQARQQQQPGRTRQQALAWQQRQGWQQQGSWQGRSSWQQSRAQQWESEHRTWAQRGGYGGYYIPQERFRLSFGNQHWFRIRNRPTIYMGYPRFEYGGFSFMLVDPWPEYWGEDWYDTDDVYIDYDDGYYLQNRRYPSVRLAITVAL